MAPQPDNTPYEKLILIAASGLAREALAVIRAHKLYDVIGFLDDSRDLSGSVIDGVPVLDTLDGITSYPVAKLVICAGRGSVRKKIVSRLEAMGVSWNRYVTISHPSVEIPSNCSIGSGSIILGGVAFTTAIRVGEHVVIMPNATLTHDCVLESFATICAGVALGGNVTVESAAYLGMNSCVREQVRVGADATLGMGSVLLRDLPPGETWAGVPARPISRAMRSS